MVSKLTRRAAVPLIGLGLTSAWPNSGQVYKGSSPGAAPFNPTSLIGTQGGFWRADAGVSLSGSNVTGWADQGSHGNNLTVAGTSPTFSATGFNGSFPGITVISTGAILSSTGLLTSTTASLIMLLIDNTGSPAGGRVGTITINGGNDFTTPAIESDFASAGSFELFSSGHVGNGGGNTSFSQSVPVALGWILDGANGNVNKNFANVGSATAFTATVGGATLQLVLSDDGNVGANFTLAYVLLTNIALSGTNLSNLKSWTNSNWGTSF